MKETLNNVELHNYTVPFPSLNITGRTNENDSQCGLCNEHKNYNLTFTSDTV